MSKVFSMEINILKTFIEKFGKDNTLIISAEIENQINELAENEKKNYMDMIGLKDTGIKYVNSKRL